MGVDGPVWPWQQGYGVVSVSRKDLASVMDYIRKHHRSDALLQHLEATEPDRDG